MKPKVSVIIPVYNQQELIKRAIRSIPLRQDIEIIVIDDCSTDNTLSVVREAQLKTDRNLVALYNDKNMGVGFTVNRGYDLATGDYVVLLGSDDYFDIMAFEYVIDKFLGVADLVYFDLEINDGTIWHINNENKRDYCGSVKFMRREFIGDTRNPEVRHSEDQVFYERLLEKKPVELFTGICVKHYNFPRENSLSWKVRNNV